MSRVVYRIGFGSDPWTPIAVPKFKERFDDPDRQKRTLYACSQRLGTFVEKLAQFRRSTLHSLAEIQHAPDDHLRTGIVPVDWLLKQSIGKAIVHGQFADICSAEWITRLRPVLEPHLAHCGLSEFDASVLQQAKYRHLTQMASKAVRTAGYAGIYYRSRFGHDFENWAIFEPWAIDQREAGPIQRDDPDLVKALQLLGLELQVLST